MNCLKPLKKFKGNSADLLDGCEVIDIFFAILSKY